MKEPWRTSRIWEGRTVVIVGGGASFSARMARMIGIARARDQIRVVAINDAVYPCWFADILYAADAQWWRYHGELAEFPGLKVSIDQHTPGQAPKPPTLPDYVDFLKNTGQDGFDPDPSALRTGQNGGYQAVHLVAHLGAPRIVLVAYDMGDGYWFGGHPTLVKRALPNIPKRIRLFEDLAAELKKRGVQVVNASPKSALNCFPRVDLARELSMEET